MRLLVALLCAYCFAGCSRADPLASTRAPAPIVVTLIHTSDEHGWIEAGEQEPGWMSGGAAEMMGLWHKNDAYPNSSSVVLTSGDMWAGPAVSTWSKGAAAVEVMNAMGYQAAVLGNHEFDFGPAILAERRAGSKFAYLAANLTARDGSPSGVAEPFRVVEVSGIHLGIVGLANRDTTSYLSEQNTAGLAFGDYAPALRSTVPEARQRGAELVVVLAHECAAPLAALATAVTDLNLPVMLGGHCHAARAQQVGRTWVVQSGQQLGSYSRVDIELDARSRTVQAVRVRLVKNAWRKGATPPAPPDRRIAAIVHKWSEQGRAELGRVVGYTDTGIGRPALYNLVTRAWLSAVGADLAISNAGAFRQDIPPGEITLASLLGVLPFENTIMKLALTGAQVTEDLTCCEQMVISGMKSDERLDPAKVYRVLVNSFMYSVPSLPFARQDPRAEDTGIPWREPVVRWIEAQNSCPAKPLALGTPR